LGDKSISRVIAEVATKSGLLLLKKLGVAVPEGEEGGERTVAIRPLKGKKSLWGRGTIGNTKGELLGEVTGEESWISEKEKKEHMIFCRKRVKLKSKLQQFGKL